MSRAGRPPRRGAGRRPTPGVPGTGAVRRRAAGVPRFGAGHRGGGGRLLPMSSRPSTRSVRLSSTLCALLALVGCALVGGGGAPPAAAVVAADEPAAFELADERIAESSGLAASRRHRGVYWTHNDSGYRVTRLYAVDGASGETVATVTLRDVEGRDLEAVSVGPDGRVYVGDIGDNLGGTWPEVWLYRFPEPERLRDTTLTPERFTVRYEDGPRDAEALMVHPRTGRVYIASKSRDGDAGLYEGPAALVATGEGVNTFRRIADLDLEVTDGAFSPDGTRLVLRGYFTGRVYAWRTTEDGGRLGADLGRLRVPLQRQGESLTFAPDGRTVMVGSEGVHSTVEPVELAEEQLPEAARRADRAGDGGGAGGAGDDGDGGLGVPAVGVLGVVAVALLLGMRRKGRRG